MSQYEYYVSKFTGTEIDERLEKIPEMESGIDELKALMVGLEQGLAEVVTLPETTNLSN